MAFQWSEDLSTGAYIIDNHHKGIFKAVNSLLSAIEEGKGADEIGKVIEFLGYYVVEHFRAEERLMRKYNYYDGYLPHKTDHTQFVKDFAAFKKEFETNGATSRLVLQIQYWLYNWLMIHIGREDKKLGAFMKGRKK